ncbi:MAG TPA: M13-type metalloendopeptidase [Gammaproteobacteria bacterium]|nr:M13-type metalloendopeptidase [Gammaproteobacteria bacterium]
MKPRLLGALCASFFLAACAAPEADPFVAPPAASGVALANFDTSVRPQDDFYRYVNGTWLRTTPIPPDRSNYGSFTQLADETEKNLRALIEAAANDPDLPAGSEARKVGDFYASFMDEAKADELGLRPLAAELAAIEAVQSRDALLRLMAHFQRIGVRSPVGGFINTDARQSDRYIVYFFQSGLGLPDRDYYLSADAKFESLRASYLAHIERMLTLAGEPRPAEAARDILALETRLAQAHWDRVKSRDDTLTYNKYAVAELGRVTPGFAWERYLGDMGIRNASEVILMQPSYFQELGKAFDEVPLETWKRYARWSLISSFAPYLDRAFVEEDFGFYGKTLRGVQENRPRWKRGVAAVENALGFAVGKMYVARHFPPEAKARMQALVANLIEAYRQSITSLDWMSEQTKQRALEKLAKFTPKIGYPDTWRDYSALEVVRGDLVGNVMRANVFEFERQAAKLGQPVDRSEWFMTPQTVNAYYNPGMNEIVFPAAILQPPFFDMTADDAVNYGAIGAVIGHEIGHGFDDQGSKYDGDGNLNNWWTDADRAEFEKRAKRLIDQYDGFEPLPGQRVNGALTIGENIGDLGGLTIAYHAYRLALKGGEAPVLDGFTGEQRFFIGWAQVWRRLYREQELLNRLKTDPHAPSEYRTNGVLANMPEFYAAFDVKEGDRLYLPPERRVKIW